MIGTESILRVGVVGLGYWGPNLIRNFSAIDQCDLVAACDLDQQRLQTIGRVNRHLYLTPNYDEMLSKVDAVAVATPVQTHFSLARQAISAGKHVLVEKPITNKSSQAEELIELSEQRNLTLMVDHTFVYHPAVKAVKSIIEAGEMGKLRYYESSRQNWGLHPSDLNVIWDLAVHDVAIANYLFSQDPTEVLAIGNRFGRQPVEDRANVHLFYPENFYGDVAVSKIFPGKVRSITIVGERKSVVYNDLTSDEKVKIYEREIEEELTPEEQYAVRWNYRVGPVYSPNVSATEALANVCRHFLESILLSRKPLTGGEEGLKVVRVLEKADESMREGGRRIEVCP